MSDELLPSLPGLEWGTIKVPKFRTQVQRAASGRELRASFYSTPLYEFELSYQFLRWRYAHRELQALLGFMCNRRGQFDSWLFQDMNDCFAGNELVGTGDGVTTTWQLYRTVLGSTWKEPVRELGDLVFHNTPWAWDGTTPMWGSGSDPMWPPDPEFGDYTISATGQVTFVTPPPAGQTIYWSGYFYFRCRFLSDEYEFKEFMDKRFSNGGLRFVGSLNGKI